MENYSYKVTILLTRIFALVPSYVIVPFTTTFALLQPNKSDLNIEILNLVFLLTEYFLFDKSFTLIYFRITNFNTVESFNTLVFKFMISVLNISISCLFTGGITNYPSKIFEYVSDRFIFNFFSLILFLLILLSCSYFIF